MDTKFSTNRKFTRMFTNILSYIAILAIALANTGFSYQAPQRPSTDNWDGSAVLKPSVLRETSSYKMWYDGVGFDGTTQVGLAKSRDGMSWNKSPQNPVLHGDSGAWDASGEHAPFVMKDGDLYKMWYEGFDGNVRQLGYATSPDGVNWTKYEGNPVLRAEPGYDEVVAGHGSVLYEDGMYKLWYHAVGDQGIIIAFATSLDGINWTKEGPVLLQEAGNWDEFGLWGPSVLKVSGIYWMWYSASGPDPINPVSIGLATSADGINWERYGEGPVVTDPNGGFIGDPTVINDSGLFKMWYGNFGDGTIYYAESENGFDWTEPMPALLPWMDVQAGNASPFVGHWQAIDVDGSDIRLVISGPPNGPFQITWTESYISYCGGEAGILRGIGWFSEEDFNLLEADLHLECFTTGATLDFHLIWQYHPTTNTLSSIYENGFVTIWHRPGGGQVEEPPILGLRVNYGHDWVESFYEGGHTAWVTVTDGDGNLKATAEMVTEPKDYWDGETGFQTNDSVWFGWEGNQLEYPPDIQPYDWVYGWVDNGASAQVQIGEVNGAVHLVDDYIEGTIYAPWFSNELEVDCHSWGAPLPEEILKYDTVLPNGEDTYFCSWAGEWDIQPYQDIGVGYSGPDGHWVANAIIPPNPRIVASEAGDWFWVTEFYPGLLDLFIYESADEGAALLWSGQQEAMDLWGITSVGYDLHGQDLIPGNYLIVSDGVNSKGLVLQPISVTMFDIQYDFMSGVAPAGNEVWAAAGPQDWQERIMVEADPETGEWFADFAAIGFDIEEDMQPWSYAQIYDEDGDANEGSVPPLELWIAAFTYDPPNWTEGEHSYYFENSYAFPAPYLEITDPISFTADINAPRYDGYVQLRYWSLIAQSDGECSPVDPLLSSEQLTRFQYGWLTDYPMTFEEALAHFESMTVNVYWNDENQAELFRHEIMPYSPDDWPIYSCSLSDGPPVPTFVAYLPSTIVGYDWPMEDLIDISINDDEYTAQAQVGNADWDPTVVLFELWQDDFFMEADDHIVMTDAATGMTKEVWVTNLAVAGFDLSAKTVSGVYDPAYDLWTWLYDIEGQVPEMDPDTGTWVATFSELPLGAWGGATQWDEDGDGTSIDFQVPTTRFTIWPEQNYLEGYEWPEGALVSISVTDKGVCSTDATSAFPEWDPSNTFFSVNFPEDCAIEVGDFITLSYESLSLTHQVQALAITDVDLDFDTVAGAAVFDPDQYIFHTWIHGVDESYMQLSMEGGNWLADFSFLESGLQPGMGGRVELVDQASNATAVDWWIPNPRIVASITEDWFYVNEFNPNTELSFAVYTSQGGTLVSQGTTPPTDDSGHMWVNADGLWDLVPGNYLVVSDGLSTKDLVVEEFTFDIFNATNGQLSGTAPEPLGRNVWVGIGWENDGWSMDVTTEETGAWFADFGQPVPTDYWWVAAQIFDDDGDASELRPASQIIFLRPACGDTYTVQVGSLLEIRYGSWVAIGKDLAIQNAEHLTVEMVLNGETVAGAQQPVVPRSEIPCGMPLDDAFGVYYVAQVDSLSSGTYVATVTWSFDIAVTDGYDADGDGVPDRYGPGEVFTREFTIIVP